MATKSEHDDTLEKAINTYKDADVELKQSRERLTKTRDLARMLVGSGIGSDEQKAWVAENLPVRTRTRKDAETDAE